MTPSANELELDAAQLRQALQAALERANQLEQVQAQVLVMAAHDVRAPLTAVIGFLELLSEEPDGIARERAGRFLSRARLASEELLLLLENMADALRGQVDRSRLNFQAVEVGQTIEQVIGLISARARQKLLSQAPRGLFLWADERKTRRVLFNLLANAVTYSPPQSAVSVEVGQDGQTGMVRISVRDEGPGIALEDQPRLFEKFGRLSDPVHAALREAGFGLSISRLLIESMNGQIGVQSAPGQGSTFWFSLPARP